MLFWGFSLLSIKVQRAESVAGTGNYDWLVSNLDLEIWQHLL